jgi:D-sedoheptulose 7-phosphate isomerase
VRKYIEQCLLDSSKTLAETAKQAETIEKIAALLIETFRKGGKVLVFGNGGSAADSQHFADELVGRYERNRPPLPALALTVNSSDLTSIANDFGYDVVFQRQLEAHAKPGDVAVGISTSGRSKNVLLALESARKLGLKTVGMTGGEGLPLKNKVDLCVCVPSKVVARIQECHIAVLQTLCGLVEDALFADAPKAH